VSWGVVALHLDGPKQEALLFLSQQLTRVQPLLNVLDLEHDERRGRLKLDSCFALGPLMSFHLDDRLVCPCIRQQFVDILADESKEGESGVFARNCAQYMQRGLRVLSRDFPNSKQLRHRQRQPWLCHSSLLSHRI